MLIKNRDNKQPAIRRTFEIETFCAFSSGVSDLPGKRSFANLTRPKQCHAIKLFKPLGLEREEFAAQHLRKIDTDIQFCNDRNLHWSAQPREHSTCQASDGGPLTAGIARNSGLPGPTNIAAISQEAF
jgi:hypothetical protein